MTAASRACASWRFPMPHDEFHYSITCHSVDPPVIYCLRGIAEFAERHPQKHIAWGNTGDDYWKEDGYRVTFHFSHPDYRQVFRDVANDILRERWDEVSWR